MNKAIKFLNKILFKGKRFPYRKYQDKKRCIFIHIPKAAGTSVLQTLGKDGVTGRDHLSWLVYKKANAQKFDSYFKFAFVRDPLDRAYSAYQYLLNGGNQQHDLVTGALIKQYKSFEDFIIRGLARGLFRNHVMFLPQSFFIINNENELVVDFVGKFENINEDFHYIKEKLNLKSTLKHENRGVGDFKSTQKIRSNAEVMEWIYIIYAQDYLLLDYSTE